MWFIKYVDVFLCLCMFKGIFVFAPQSGCSECVVSLFFIWNKCLPVLNRAAGWTSFEHLGLCLCVHIDKYPLMHVYVGVSKFCMSQPCLDCSIQSNECSCAVSLSVQDTVTILFSWLLSNLIQRNRLERPLHFVSDIYCNQRFLLLFNRCKYTHTYTNMTAIRILCSVMIKSLSTGYIHSTFI